MAEAHALNLLLSASSRDVVAKFFNTCFRYRHTPEDAGSSRHVIELGLDPLATAKLVYAGIETLNAVMYHSASINSAEEAAALLPAGVDPRLTSLIAGILFAGLPMWRDAAIDSRVSLPKLISSDWKVSLVDSNSLLNKAGTATVELDLKIRDASTSVAEMPAERGVAVELNHASLGAMVEGMRRVRDQLAMMH